MGLNIYMEFTVRLEVERVDFAKMYLSALVYQHFPSHFKLLKNCGHSDSRFPLYFLELSSVHPAQLCLLKCSNCDPLQFIVPYLLGWHTFANSIKPEDTNRGNNANPRAGADYEWSRQLQVVFSLTKFPELGETEWPFGILDFAVSGGTLFCLPKLSSNYCIEGKIMAKIDIAICSLIVLTSD